MIGPTAEGGRTSHRCVDGTIDRYVALNDRVVPLLARRRETNVLSKDFPAQLRLAEIGVDFMHLAHCALKKMI